ncbi:hypothetical protein AALD22_16040 [Lachnospiraceae bacterium 56-18]|jgi:hypothetical protein
MKLVKSRIDKNYECIREIEQLISLKKSDEEKLGLISLAGKFYSEYITGVYSCNMLEQQIIEIGRKINYIPTKEASNKKILIVMSACSSVGGHTVLVHNWIKWDDEKSYSVVFTNMRESQTPDFIKKIVKLSGGSLIYLSGSYMEKASSLLEISEEFCRVLLFTHMEDIVPVIAYSNNQWNIPVYFYNHADFRFSYGFSVSDIVLNLTDFDVDKTIRYRGIDEKESICFQFPGYGQIDDIKNRVDKQTIRLFIEEKYGLEKDEKLIVSMGNDFKYENIIGYEFDAYIEAVLSKYNGKCSFFIIGADGERQKWIKLNKKTHGKAKALGILPRKEAERLIAGADIYIVSFPMTAAGQQDAECAGVPYLGLNMYGRGIREDDIRFSKSVNELIRKTLEILEGNKLRYLSEKNADVWTKEEWKREWKKICDNITHHKVHLFYPQRYIEKQEYVNCQLMQEEAARKVCDYIMANSLSGEVKKEIFRLDRKYDMGLSYCNMINYERECESLKNLSDKHLQLYLTAIKWVETRQKKIKIDEFLSEKGYCTAAIYGMSYMGERLAYELKDSSIEVLYGIDKDALNKHMSIPIFLPSELPERVDIIINTTMIENACLLEELNLKGVSMISINELLDVSGRRR